MNLIIFTAVLLACEAANFNRDYLPPQGVNSESSHEGPIVQEPVSQRGHKENVKNIQIESTASHLDRDQNVNDSGNTKGLNFDVQHQQKEWNSYNDFSAEKSKAFSENSTNQNQSPTRFKSEETFAYKYETENGIRAEENGIADNGVKAKGSFSYVGDDGEMYRIAYTADENGYRPFGDHIPTSPPIPEAILRSIERNAEDEAAGIFDDGKYHPEYFKSGLKNKNNYNYVTDSDIHVQQFSYTPNSESIPETPEYLPTSRVSNNQHFSDGDINNLHGITTTKEDKVSSKSSSSVQDELIEYQKGQIGIEENNQANVFTAPSQDNRAITGTLNMDSSETTEYYQEIYSTDIKEETVQQLDYTSNEDIKENKYSNVEIRPKPRVLNIPAKYTSDIMSSTRKADDDEKESSSNENSEQKNREIVQTEESPGFNGVVEVVDYIDSDISDQAETKTDEHLDANVNSHPQIYYGPSFEIRKTLNVTGEPKQYNLSEIDFEAKRKEYCKLRCKAHLDEIRKKQKYGNIAKTLDDNFDFPSYSNIPQNITTGLQILVNESKNSDKVTGQNGDSDKQVNKEMEIVTNYPQNFQTNRENISSTSPKDFHSSKNLSYSPPYAFNTIQKNQNVQPNVDVASENFLDLPNNNDVQTNVGDIQQNNNNSHQVNSYLSKSEPSNDFVPHNIRNIITTYDNYSGLPKNISNIFKNHAYSEKVIFNVSQNAVDYSKPIASEPQNIERGSKSYLNSYQNIDNVPREIESSEQQNARGELSDLSESDPVEIPDEKDLLRSLFEKESSFDEALPSSDSPEDRLEANSSQTRRPPYYDPDTGYHY